MKHIAHIPLEPGYRFTGIYADGTSAPFVVHRQTDSDGVVHYSYVDESDVSCAKLLIGWEPLQ